MSFLTTCLKKNNSANINNSHRTCEAASLLVAESTRGFTVRKNYCKQVSA